MTFRDENVAVRRDDYAGRLGESGRRISRHARFAEREEHRPVGTELDDRVAFAGFAREFLLLALVDPARVGHPNVSVAIGMDLVRKNKHPGAEGYE